MDAPVFHHVLAGPAASGKTHHLRQLITAELEAIELGLPASVWAASPTSGLEDTGLVTSPWRPALPERPKALDAEQVVPALDRWLTSDVHEALTHAHRRAIGRGPTAEIGRPLLLVLDAPQLPTDEDQLQWLLDIWLRGPDHGVRLAIAVQRPSVLPVRIQSTLLTHAVVTHLPDRRAAHVPTREA